ncbi:hypothetical protein D9M68_755670 [compost metagenome]
MEGAPHIAAWVVGQSIAPGVGREKKLSENGRDYGLVRATTFDALVDTANMRLIRLREVLKERYDQLPTDQLVAKVLAVQEQAVLDLSASKQPSHDEPASLTG